MAFDFGNANKDQKEAILWQMLNIAIRVQRIGIMTSVMVRYGLRLWWGGDQAYIL